MDDADLQTASNYSEVLSDEYFSSDADEFGSTTTADDSDDSTDAVTEVHSPVSSTSSRGTSLQQYSEASSFLSGEAAEVGGGSTTDSEEWDFYGSSDGN